MSSKEEITAKLQEEVDAHNTLAEQIDKATQELHQRKGRVSLLQEQLVEVSEEESEESDDDDDPGNN